MSKDLTLRSLFDWRPTKQAECLITNTVSVRVSFNLKHGVAAD